MQYVQTAKIQTHPTFKLVVRKQKGELQPLDRYISYMPPLYIYIYIYIKGAYKSNGEIPVIRALGDRTTGDGFRLNMSRFTLDIKKKSLNEGGETLEQVVQLSCGCPFVLTLPGNICIS